MKKKGSVLSAALLLAGYIIGTTYIAIPIVTGPSGFFPAVGMTVFTWLYLIVTSMFFLEATLANPAGAHVITICRNFIGRGGMIIAAFCFILLNYYYLSSYYAVGIDSLKIFLTDIPVFVFYVLITFIFGGSVFLGIYVTDRFNFILFMGLIISFISMLVIGSEAVIWENLIREKWYFVFFAVPTLITAFDFQSLLPTLSSYLDRDPKKLKRMIWIGSAFPLFFYLGWQWLTIGSINPGILWEAYETGKPIYEGLLLIKTSGYYDVMFRFTALFALTTSLLGVGLAVVDFLGDGFNIPLEKRKGLKRLYLVALVYIPAILLSFLFPTLFTEVVSYIVGWADVVFDGIIPLWLIAKMRYVLKIETTQIVPGGKIMLAIVALITFFVIYLEGVEIIRT